MNSNLYIYCEGQTEESFINKVLGPYFFNFNIFITPIICTTKKTPTTKYKGGISSYKKFRDELEIICKQHPNEYITTMFDYYGFPQDAPGMDNIEHDIYDRIKIIEEAIFVNINKQNCKINLMLHEFESVLFADPTAFNLLVDDNTVNEIQNVKGKFETPEHINNSVHTSPSKRLESIIQGYSKVRDGTIISEKIGIDTIMKECQHFAEWINSLKQWVIKE